jgi:7-dehydrocholesterol reductase
MTTKKGASPSKSAIPEVTS